MRAGGRDPFSCTVTKALIHISLAHTAITLSAVPRNLDKQLFTLRSLRSLRENRYLLSCSMLKMQRSWNELNTQTPSPSTILEKLACDLLARPSQGSLPTREWASVRLWTQSWCLKWYWYQSFQGRCSRLVRGRIVLEHGIIVKLPSSFLLKS